MLSIVIIQPTNKRFRIKPGMTKDFPAFARGFGGLWQFYFKVHKKIPGAHDSNPGVVVSLAESSDEKLLFVFYCVGRNI